GCTLSSVVLGAFDELPIPRHFDLQHVYTIAVLADLSDALNDDLRFLFGVVEAFFICAFFISDEFQEKGNVISAALIAKTLYPRMFLVINFLTVEGCVVEQYFDAF